MLASFTVAVTSCWIGAGCGATVVFGDQNDTEEEGGAPPVARECILSCGQTCTKCAGSPDDGPDVCFTGECSEEGLCIPADTAPPCP